MISILPRLIIFLSRFKMKFKFKNIETNMITWKATKFDQTYLEIRSFSVELIFDQFFFLFFSFQIWKVVTDVGRIYSEVLMASVWQSHWSRNNAFAFHVSLSFVFYSLLCVCSCLCLSVWASSFLLLYSCFCFLFILFLFLCLCFINLSLFMYLHDLIHFFVFVCGSFSFFLSPFLISLFHFTFLLYVSFHAFVSIYIPECFFLLSFLCI